MSFFDYPLDYESLLRKKKYIKEELLKKNNATIEKRVAVLGGSSTQELVDQLEIFLLNQGIKASFYQSDYGRFFEEAVFENHALELFSPDIIVIHTTWRNISAFPDINFTREESDSLLTREYRKFEQIWLSLENKYHCPIIQNNFDRPNFRLLGNRDIWDYRGRCNFVFNLNAKLYEYAQSKNNFFINDIDYISHELGDNIWSDNKVWALYKYACSLNAFPFLARSICNIIKSLYGKNKKVLVLDLDNTLWGGVIGEDGVDNIRISSESAEGLSYLEFQEYCYQLKQLGILLAIDSKNELQNALVGLDHPDSKLKRKDFVSIKANWQPKHENIKNISEELSLGIDSFVFIDDNRSEQENIIKFLPSVSVPLESEPYSFIKAIDRTGYFEITSISDEDRKKSEQYIIRSLIKAEQSLFTDYREFLCSLDMKCYIYTFASIYTQRIAQLTNKTNQFNLTSFRYTEDDIKKMQNDENRVCLCVRLVDRFSDNGIVSVMSALKKENYLLIDLWLMSCRVLKRSLEYALMNYMVRIARSLNYRCIKGIYIPSSKNMMVRDLYSELGFTRETVSKDGSVCWTLYVDHYNDKESPIEVISP